MKRLKITTSPITTFIHEAHTCNVVLGGADGYMWLYDSWIQWEWRANVLDAYMPETITSNLPLVKWYAIPNALLSKTGRKFVDLVMCALDHDFYVVTCVNKRMISSVSNNFERHEVLIYGYDETKNEFYITDYDLKGIYGECVCTFEELANSYEHMGSQILWDDDTVVLVRRKQIPFFRTDLFRMSNLLEDYLQSRSSWWRFNNSQPSDTDDPNQGINAYDRVIEYIQTIYSEHSYLDIRTFCTIRDHKYIMYERIKYLKLMGYINPHNTLSDRYERVYHYSEQIKLLALKYAVTTELRVLDSLVLTINQMREKEKEILEAVYEEMKKTCHFLCKYDKPSTTLLGTWIPINKLPCASVPTSRDADYITMKDGDSITVWDVEIDDALNLSLPIMGSVSYKISNIRGKGCISAYFDMTGSTPGSVLVLDELVGSQIKTADFQYKIPANSPLLHTDIHFYAQGDANFSFDLYAIRLDYNEKNKRIV